MAPELWKNGSRAMPLGSCLQVLDKLFRLHNSIEEILNKKQTCESLCVRVVYTLKLHIRYITASKINIYLCQHLSWLFLCLPYFLLNYECSF